MHTYKRRELGHSDLYCVCLTFLSPISPKEITIPDDTVTIYLRGLGLTNLGSSVNDNLQLDLRKKCLHYFLKDFSTFFFSNGILDPDQGSPPRRGMTKNFLHPCKYNVHIYGSWIGFALASR